MADKTTASIAVAAPRADVMAVIADFPAYPEWASGVRSAEVIGRGDGGRASRVRWVLAEPGSVITALTGGYLLADAGGGTEVTYDLAVDVRIPMPGMLKRRA